MRCGNLIFLVQASGCQSPKFVIRCMGGSLIHCMKWVGWLIHCMREAVLHCMRGWRVVIHCMGQGGNAINCMKGRRVPEVVNINPELRYEFGFIGGTISVSEFRQLRKRSGRLYFIIERCIMHFISKLSLTNFMKIRFREPEVVTIHPGLRYEV